MTAAYKTAKGRTGVLAKKIGMTRIFDENGKHVPVTVLQVADNVVLGHRTDAENGYTAIQVGAVNQKMQRMNKAQRTQLETASLPAKKKMAEFRVSAENLAEIGTELKADIFEAGQTVDITGTTKGRGFAGAMKRHNFGGLRASHGVSVSHRSHGSTGQCQDPGKVFKGKKMAGHYGAARQTTQNLKVVKIDADKNVILIKGAVPGANGGLVAVRDAIKAKK